MATRHDLSIEQIIARTTAEITAAVHASIATEVNRIVGAVLQARVASTPAAHSSAPLRATRAPRSPGRPGQKKAAKRAWPVCGVASCGKGFFAPSGKRRLCYDHYV